MKKLLVCIGILLVISGCSTTPPTPENRVVLQSEVVEAISIFKKVYPEIKYYFEQSAGYAVFPKVFKGAVLAGGAYGVKLKGSDPVFSCRLALSFPSPCPPQNH